MNILCGFIIACAMYSKIPMPHVEWTEERMQYALCFFPVVGVMEGTALALAGWICIRLAFLPVTAAIILTVFPVLMNGGIHMDGYLDVVDALSSYGEREKKLQIMKDPNCGAFAVIFGMVYFLIYLAVMLELPMQVPVYISCAGVFVMSRALSGLAVICFPKARKEGLVSTFSRQANKTVTVIVLLGWLIAALTWFWVMGSVLMFVVLLGTGIIVYACYYHLCMREFGGVNGDLAGFFLQILELGLLFMTVIVFRL